VRARVSVRDVLFFFLSLSLYVSLYVSLSLNFSLSLCWLLKYVPMCTCNNKNIANTLIARTGIFDITKVTNSELRNVCSDTDFKALPDGPGTDTHPTGKVGGVSVEISEDELNALFGVVLKGIAVVFWLQMLNSSNSSCVNLLFETEAQV
jgi:hypothetical protein